MAAERISKTAIAITAVTSFVVFALMVIGFVFYYDDTPSAPEKGITQAYTVWLVDRALDRYEDDGLGATLDHYNSQASLDGSWYVFVADQDGIIIGHHDNELRGQSLTGPLGTDVTGYEFGRAMVEAGEQGRWVSYVFNNPETGQQQRKHSWVVRHDGYLFGSGWYEHARYSPPPPSKTNAPDYTIWLVDEALARYERDGAEAAIEYYNSPQALDGPWYAFVLEDRDDGLYAVANSNRPDLVGTTYERIDAAGYDYGAAFEQTVEGGAGQWVSYLFTHPETREDALKHTWIVRRGDLLFGAGWYEGIK